MTALVPCLVRLRSDFNDLFPGRDHTSDGWIGDPAHQSRASDHNPGSRGLVHAIDVDRDLGSGADLQAFVDHIVARCRTGAEKRLTYVIYDRTIWSATRGWVGRRYTGGNPHDKHAHFSASSAPVRERDVSTWHLEEVPVALTPADKKFITDLLAAKPGAAALDLDAPLFPGAPSASWTGRFPASPATVRNALAFAAYDSHDAEKMLTALAGRVATLERLLAERPAG